MKKFKDKLGNEVKRNDWIWCDCGQMSFKYKVIKIISNQKIKVKWTLSGKIKKLNKNKDNIYLDCEEYTKIRQAEKESFKKLAFRGAAELFGGIEK